MSPVIVPLVTDRQAVEALAACLSDGPTGAEHLPEAERFGHLMAVLEAETKVAGLENLYAGLRDGTYDHRNVPPPYLALVTGTGWHDRNDNAAVLIAAALDRAHDELAALRGESR